MGRGVRWATYDTSLTIHGTLEIRHVDGRKLYACDAEPGEYWCHIGFQSFFGPRVGRFVLSRESVRSEEMRLVMVGEGNNIAECSCDLLVGCASVFGRHGSQDLRDLFKLAVSNENTSSVIGAGSDRVLAISSPVANGITEAVSRGTDKSFILIPF